MLSGTVVVCAICLIRCFLDLVVVQMHPQKLSPEELRNEKEKLADFFRARQGENGVSIDGLLFQTSTNLSTGFLPTACDVLFGSEFVHEKLLGLQFRISPQAFFQSNTPAAEVLYRTIQDFCGALDQASTTVLDLCCGTGTIGLSLASQVRHVVGIELNEDAVKDAIVNARLNSTSDLCTSLLALAYASRFGERGIHCSPCSRCH